MKGIHHFFPVIIFLLLSFTVNAQLMQGGMPHGLLNRAGSGKMVFHKIETGKLSRYIEEDKMLDTIAEIPWRFGKNISVYISPENAGTWITPTDTHKIWQTGICSPGAISINLVFHPFRIPRGAKLFVYSKDGREVLGAFDHRNNQEDGYFATSLIFTDSVVVEYQEPTNAEFRGQVVIEQVTHGYRHPRIFTDKLFGDAGSCNINASCNVAQAYANQIRSVALLLVESNSFCTGTLINNVREDGTPYILSANHCYRTPSTVVFWFNWDSETCDNPTIMPAHQALSGATLKARYAYNSLEKTGSDFWLIEMNHLPPYEYNLFYSGWNRATDPLEFDSVVGIHHPSGDIKKFSWSTDSIQLWGYGATNDTFNTHWRVKSWDEGTTTEGGSSGSALFDHKGRIIGQLHGGLAACGNTEPDWYGRFCISWEGGGEETTGLKTWLDPNTSDTIALDGYQPVYHLLQSSVNNMEAGTIDASFYVMDNHSHTFYITTASGHTLMDVLVDGVSVGAVTSYSFDNVTGNHTIKALFDIHTYILTATAGANGSIDPQGEVVVEHGTNQSFSIIPNEGYYIQDVLIDEVSVGAVATYNFDNITSNHTIEAVFAIHSYTLTATAGTNGSIDPQGEVVVEHGTNQSFSIIPNEGYYIQDVLVDGVSVGAVAIYTFENITGNHTIEAVFAIHTYTLTATAGTNGSIDPQGEVVVEHGASQSFNIIPSEGYYIQDVLVDDVSLGAVTSYTFENITGNHTLEAVFAIHTYTLTATAGANGRLDPQGEVVVEHGASQSFSILPDEGYHIQDVMVDGISVGVDGSYTFQNISRNHTLEAKFTINTYTLTTTAGANGSIDPQGDVVVEHGASQSFRILPNEGYHIQDVLIDGVGVGAVNLYNFVNVTDNHTIHAFFEQTSYQVIFDVKSEKGPTITNAVITLPDHENEAGNYIFNTLLPGSYTYTVTCDKFFPAEGVVVVEDADVSVSVILLIDDTAVTEEQASNVQVYPNPAKNEFTVKSASEIRRLKLVDISGRVVLERSTPGHSIRIGTDDLKAGLYILRIELPRGLTQQKIQINR